REMVGHLQAEGRDLTDASAALAGWGVPEGVRQVIGRRIARLSPTANQVLHVGAMLGESFSSDVAQAVSGLDGAPLLDALDEALAAGLLREADGRYRFRHALIRETLYA